MQIQIEFPKELKRKGTQRKDCVLFQKTRFYGILLVSVQCIKHGLIIVCRHENLDICPVIFTDVLKGIEVPSNLHQILLAHIPAVVTIQYRHGFSSRNGSVGFKGAVGVADNSAVAEGLINGSFKRMTLYIGERRDAIRLFVDAG